MASHHTTTNDLVDRALRDGMRDHAAAARAVDATLGAFAGCLSRDEALALASALSRRLAEVVERSEARADGDAGAFFARVRDREGVPLGLAREHAAIVLRALAEGIDPALHARLSRSLPADLAALLSPRASVEPPERSRPSPAPPLTTLASGRPGYRHPIDEARPSTAQAHSVADEANPHADTKLSSARGLTQDQLRESLATGAGTRGRPISEARDEPRPAREPDEGDES